MDRRCLTHEPVIPIALSGVRGILRDGTWLPRRGKVVVTLLEPVQPTGVNFGAMLRLRDNVRRAIARHCGEPLLTGDAVQGSSLLG